MTSATLLLLNLLVLLAKTLHPRGYKAIIAENLRILDVTEVKSVPFTPVSHPFVERVIGTIRREHPDQVPFWNSLDLQRKLDEFKGYYNQHRTHTALPANVV